MADWAHLRERTDGWELYAGNLLFASADPAPEALEAAHTQAGLWAEWVAGGPVRAWVPAASGQGAQTEVLSKLRARWRLPVFAASRDVSTRRLADSFIATLGGHKIGVLGVAHLGQPPAAAYQAGAHRLRAEGAQWVIGLTAASFKVAQQIAAQATALDLLWANEPSGQRHAQAVGRVWVAAGGDLHRHYARLRFDRTIGDSKVPGVDEQRHVPWRFEWVAMPPQSRQGGLEHRLGRRLAASFCAAAR